MTTHASTDHIDNTWAWLAACAPLLGLLLALATPSAPSLVTWGPTVVAGVAAILDCNQLARRGLASQADWLWAILIVPLYLILRTRRAHSTPAIPVVWFVALLVTVAAGNLLTTG